MPLPEHGQDRRQDEQGERTSGQDDDRAGDPHRVDEALGEDGQCGQRRGDGERAEQDGVTRSPTDRGQGGLDRNTSSELFAEAGDDEEAEVDRQADPESDDQVEREDRERDHHQRETHDAEGDGNGEHGSDQRHRGGPKTAEHEEQQQQEERQGEELGPSEVLRGDGCDLDAGHRGAAEPGIALQ